MSKKDEALKLALECAANYIDALGGDSRKYRQALADSALDRMAENARELGLDYEPPCKTGSQCTSKCPQCEQTAQQEPVAVARVDDLERGGRVRALAMGLSLDAPLYTSPPAAQQQEPVAYSYTSRITGAQGFSHHPMPRFIDADSWNIKPLYTAKHPIIPAGWKLVPVEPTPEMLKAMDECSTEGYDERLLAGHAWSVYTAAIDATPEAIAPPRKPWVGLTDEEIHKMTVLMGINPEWKAEMEIVRSVVRNLEAKLWEKNA